MLKLKTLAAVLAMMIVLNACGNHSTSTEKTTGSSTYADGIIPAELEYIPEGYTTSAEHPGTLEKLEYQTWESFTYNDRTQALTKTAWVYLPYGYTDEQQYNVFYLSHGGWSNETTIMGTPEVPHAFKHIMNHAIEDGKM